MKLKSWSLFVVSLVLGAMIGWVDTRPGWDDAGISAGAVFLVTAGLGAAYPLRAWLYALAVGGSVLLWNLWLNGNYGAVLALGFAFVGAYAGALVRRLSRGGGTPPQEK